MISMAGSRASLLGLSTDQKPMNVEKNTIFNELDTGRYLYFDGTGWQFYAGSVPEVSGEIVVDESTHVYQKVIVDLSIPEGTTEIPANAFSGAKYIGKVKFPSTIATIGNDAFKSSNITLAEFPERVSSLTLGIQLFQNTDKLVSVAFPEGLTELPSACFIGSYVEEISLPSTMESLGTSAIRSCTHLKTIVCKAVTPPTCGSTSLSSLNRLQAIYVPSGSVNDYKAANGWSSFSNKIQAIPTN